MFYFIASSSLKIKCGKSKGMQEKVSIMGVWLITFAFQSRTYYKVTLFPLGSFYSSLKRLTLPATVVRLFTFTSNLHKVTSFFDVTAVKTNVT